uniref:Uncharacterized protein n=1 Tax=viral metagenome TaxID=1070528 RepID=A0A6C0M136_9ZZZZ
MATNIYHNMIDREIISVLIFYSDRLFSQYELNNIIKMRLGNIIKKDDFVSAFMTIENRHKNIYRFVINNNEYLVLSTKIGYELLVSIKHKKFNKHIFMTDDIDIINESFENIDLSKI